MADIVSLGKYEVRRELGRGAMGVVYEGYDPLIKRLVALKTIRPDQLAGEERGTVLARFRREAQAAGRLSHPNIVPIYEFGEDGGVSYIAMEFVRGRELKACFDAGERFRPADVVRIMGEILAALDYSHRQGVIHRDVKPANIFLLDDGSVKVADFGIAHVESSNLTQVGTVLGTPSYMSPEQILGLPVDGRSDLFSAGVILYQFLTGERPFAGSAATTMQKVLKEDPLPPSTLNVQVLPMMDAVVRKAMAKRADDRYQTAHEFADAIRAAAPGAAAGAARASAAEPTLVATAAAAPAAEPTVIATAAPTLARAPVAPDAAPAANAPAAAAAATVPARKSTMPAVVAGAVAGVVVVGALVWQLRERPAADAAKAPPAVAAATAPAAAPVPAAAPPSAAPAAPTAATSPATAPAVPAAAPGTLTIAAVGLADPTDPRYATDRSLMQAELRADARGQLVGKAVGLLVDPRSIATHYDLLQRRLLANSGNFVTTVIRESEPRQGKDGLMSITTEAVVDVKAVQKALNEMTRNERVQLIRASGDPRIAVEIDVRDADRADAPSLPSPVAENVLKERIRSFGFRTAADSGAPDFTVIGQARVRRLSTRLEASGLTITKYALTSWTVKCVDRATGEEIYHNTALPKAAGSWASEEEALKAIGTRIADEFSRDFFLQHAHVAGRRVALTIDGLPATAEGEIARELVGLPEVIAAGAATAAKGGSYELLLAGTGAAGDLVATAVLKPLNAKLGEACFTLGAISGDTVAVKFDPRCADAAVLARLDANPPAGLYASPPARQKAVVKNPDVLRRLTTI